MKRFIERVIPEHKEMQAIGYTCDMCGVETAYKDEWPNKKEESRFFKEEVTLEYRSGEYYPEGGSGESIDIHLCPRCFEDKLLPFLNEHGTHVRIEEWDF